MYSNLEIAIIVKNCKNTSELYQACSVFAYLIKNNVLRRTPFLQNITIKKFIELEIKEL